MSRPASAIAANAAQAIQPSRNGRHLTLHADPDKPFFWLADTAWELFHRLDKTEAERYLRNRAAKGFNVVMIVLFAEHGQLDFPNRFGQWPFEGGSKPDLSKPNLVYYEFVDWVIELASSLGLRVALVPTWGRYINGGYYKGPFLFTDQTAYSFGKFVGQRYPYLPYILGGDSNRFWNADMRDAAAQGQDISKLPMTDYGHLTEAMARGLFEGEQTHSLLSSYKTFIIYHSAQIWLPQGPESTGSAQFPDADWLTMDACQSGHYNAASRPRVDEEEKGVAGSQTGVSSSDPRCLPHLWRAVSSYEPIRKMYNTPRPDGHPRPVVDLEAHYENTRHWFRKPYPLWTADNIRRGAWQGIFAGACGYTYGANSIWQMHNAESSTHPPIQQPTTAFTNWNVELDLAGAFMSGTAKRIVESLPGYFERIPDQSFILSDTHEPATDLAGEELISGMREANGQWAMVHLPFGGPVELDLGKALPGKTSWRGWWWDPRIGSRETFGLGVTPGSKTFTAPDEQDWLLYLEAAL
ncbi:hypothetical protein BCR39DRAFT_543890 [Naematelia encephala]|uniref:DUF4038 domain-containing protein n=1 Tax=Naematelia encephala TaxID=71784 RepID=A0A1Y2ASI8_9TREE|nr:hypothetical protein BCR39DRAFT_543890 [Naematelia encephala]